MRQVEDVVGAVERLLPELERRLPALIDDIQALLAAGWPEHAAFVAEEREEVEAAARAQLPLLLRTASPRRSAHDGAVDDEDDGGSVAAEVLFEEVGAAQWRAGSDLPQLIAVYQACAAVAWRHVAAAALAVDVSPAVLAVLAESVFTFIDHLGSATTRGYLREQADATVARERLREELADLLVDGGGEPSALRARAFEARWPLPAEAAVVLFTLGASCPGELPVRLPGTWLPLRRPGLLGAVVADPSGPVERERVEALLAGTGAVVGESVPLDVLPSTLPAAAVALRLRRAGVLGGEPLHVTDHLDAVLVHHDRRLLAALRARVLAPLDALAAPARERLEETLAAWLRHSGARAAVAAELHVHPQTVRYRLDQLRAAFGGDLDDPAVRARLLLALGWGPPLPPAG